MYNEFKGRLDNANEIGNSEMCIRYVTVSYIGRKM